MSFKSILNSFFQKIGFSKQLELKRTSSTSILPTTIVVLPSIPDNLYSDPSFDLEYFSKDSQRTFLEASTTATSSIVHTVLGFSSFEASAPLLPSLKTYLFLNLGYLSSSNRFVTHDSRFFLFVTKQELDDFFSKYRDNLVKSRNYLTSEIASLTSEISSIDIISQGL